VFKGLPVRARARVHAHHRRIVVKPIGYNKRRMRRDYAKIRATVCPRLRLLVGNFFDDCRCDIADFMATVKRTLLGV